MYRPSYNRTVINKLKKKRTFLLLLFLQNCSIPIFIQQSTIKSIASVRVQLISHIITMFNSKTFFCLIHKFYGKIYFHCNFSQTHSIRQTSIAYILPLLYDLVPFICLHSITISLHSLKKLAANWVHQTRPTINYIRPFKMNTFFFCSLSLSHFLSSHSSFVTPSYLPIVNKMMFYRIAMGT